MPSVICVDPDPQMQRALHQLLVPRGYMTTVVATGAEVLALAFRHPPDAVVLELKLPDMTGLALVESLRKRLGARVVILAIGSGVAEKEIINVFNLGADDFLTKPVRVEELLAKLQVGIAKRATAPGRSGKLEIGSRFASRYEVQAALSAGGFSYVYRTRDITGQYPGVLALKVFAANPANGVKAERFLPFLLREASKLSNLAHPNIIRLYDVGHIEEMYYLVMEYAEGEPLADIVNYRGMLAEEEATMVGYEVASALEYLDSRRILHRDIKPANIIITTDSELKLIDFGLAKSYGERTLSESAEEFHGTAHFVSPEYITGKHELDVRSDIYSLGVTLYYAVTGVLPFQGPTLTAVLEAHFRLQPPPVHEVNPKVSRRFSEQVERMMHVDPAQRPGIAELIITLGNMILQHGQQRRLTSGPRAAYIEAVREPDFDTA